MLPQPFVVRRVDRVEQLGIDVGVELAGVGVRFTHDVICGAEVHVGVDDRAVGRGVAVRALGEAVELLAPRFVPLRVEPAKEVVEGAILEHDDHEVIEAGLGSCSSGVKP